MIWFSERKQMHEVYDDWCKKNGVADSIDSFTAFLATKGWLNEAAVKKDLKKVKED